MAFMAPVLPWLAAGSAVVGGISQMQSAQYQAAVAQNNANILEENAARERAAAAEDMQSKDMDARAQVAALMADMDASGLSADSGSFLRRRSGAQWLAGRDRERLERKADTSVRNTKQEAASYRAEAKALKKGGFLSFLTTAFNAGSSYLSGASMLNEYKAGQLQLSNPSIVR